MMAKTRKRSGMKKMNAAAVQLGRRGGLTRAKALTPDERHAIVMKAILWSRATKGGA